MSENTVLIDGEEYISSNRAAKLVGYTKDYVGQLARAGKIKAKRVGRSWYIAESSINKHKLSVHYILTKPKKNRSDDFDKNTEKNNQNIVKSSIQYSKLTLKSDTKEDVEEIKKPITESLSTHVPNVSNEIDFLPKLKEKKRDVLLHTDFRYEKTIEKPKDFEVVAKPSQPQANPNNVFDYKKVEIRKPIQLQQRQSLHNALVRNQDVIRSSTGPMRRSQKVSSTIKQRIDGIVAPSQNTIRRSEKDVYVPSVIEKVDVYKYDAPLKNRQQRYQTENENNSKAVPVIGAIIIFTLAVVLYIIFTFK
jgi:excisionase family DNA binding protein